jgi:hypothetical protein
VQHLALIPALALVDDALLETATCVVERVAG